jgi:hypothetical protein
MSNAKPKSLHLEELFFNIQDKTLTDLIEREKNDRDKTFALRSLSGISNRTILDNAVKLGINATTFGALSLVPLLQVAWADKFCDKKETQVILDCAAEVGIKKDSAPYQLLRSWLLKDINPNLFIAWKAYVHTLQETLTQVELNELKDEIIGRARSVARASGGILGIGSISSVEKDAIHQLEIVFQKGKES